MSDGSQPPKYGHVEGAFARPFQADTRLGSRDCTPSGLGPPPRGPAAGAEVARAARALSRAPALAAASSAGVQAVWYGTSCCPAPAVAGGACGALAMSIAFAAGNETPAGLAARPPGTADVPPA